MNPPNQFGSAKPVKPGEGMTCAQCEAMLPDWMDRSVNGEMTAKDRTAFELHIATCAECREMLADAQRGAALLEMLKYPRPEPPARLMDRILAATSGVDAPAKSRAGSAIALSAFDGDRLEINSVVPASTAAPVAGAPSAAASLPAGNVLPFRPVTRNRFGLRTLTHTMMQPRLAMTAAMAFFSIALTLNLTGVRLNQLSLSDLKPANLRRTFYQADASVVRYYDNLRVVYELESRVQDMKRSDDDNSNGTAQPGSGPESAPGSSSKDQPKNQQRKAAPKAGSGTSQRHNPLQEQFKLATAHGSAISPRVLPFEPFPLTSFLDGKTAIRKYKLKEMKEEGVLA